MLRLKELTRSFFECANEYPEIFCNFSTIGCMLFIFGTLENIIIRGLAKLLLTCTIPNNVPTVMRPVIIK